MTYRMAADRRSDAAVPRAAPLAAGQGAAAASPALRQGRAVAYASCPEAAAGRRQVALDPGSMDVNWLRLLLQALDEIHLRLDSQDAGHSYH